MMNKKQFINSEKECAEMLGITLNTYQENIKKIKVRKPETKKIQFDNTILDKLGLSINDLKIKENVL